MSPPSASWLRREAQTGRLMCPPPCDPPFWAPFTLPRALDIQAASVLSRSYKLGTGGPVWPGVSLYVRGCSDCAISKSPRHLPVGKLVPLLIPCHPWSHVEVNFVTNLPNSEGFTCILIAVDQLSKACRLIPLKGLPTALETAEALFHHIFRNYGVPENIVSNHGPQFI